jgi:hypothetical protein
MDHSLVVRENMTEKYLLDELGSDVKNEFEEHFFDCPDCAMDVHAASQFVAESKVVLAEGAFPSSERAASRASNKGWFAAFLRPTFYAPVFALLLAVIGYQNLVTYPHLRGELAQPKLLTWGSVNVGTWGPNGPTITVPQGQAFLLFVRIPPDGSYDHYTADLYNPAGVLEWSLAIPATPGQDQWPVQVPAANRVAGTYTMAVHGVTATGQARDLGKTSFELQILK